MSWQSVPVCAVCWNATNPNKQLDGDVRTHDILGPGIEEDCYRCGRETRSGIYVRADV